MEGKKILYIHVPRSAGASILEIFSMFNRMIFDKQDNFQIDNPTNEIQFIKLTNWLLYSPSSKVFSFTFLRHPINLFYSYYYVLKAENEIPKASWRNLQCDKSSFVNNLIKQSKDINQFIDLVLDLAPIFKNYIFPKGYYSKDVIDGLDFVGIVDYFKEGLEIICNKLHIKVNKVPLYLNQQIYNQDFSYRLDELKDFLEEEIFVYEKEKVFFEENYLKGIKVLILSREYDFLLDFLKSIQGIIIHEKIIFTTYDIIYASDVDQLKNVQANCIIMAFKKTPKSKKGYDITFRIKLSEVTYVHYTKTKRDITFIIQGGQNLEKLQYQHCVYGIFGNIELSTWDLYDEPSILNNIDKYNIINHQNIYLQMYTTLRGLQRVFTKWVIKVRSDEIFSDWQRFISIMKESSNTKLTCTNIFFRKKTICLHISDHIIGGQRDTLYNVVTTCMKNLEKGKPDSINNMLLWRAPEVWITTGHLENLYGFDQTYMNLQMNTLRKMMLSSFNIVPVDEMGNYIISFMQNTERREITQKTKFKYRADVFELNNINDLD